LQNNDVTFLPETKQETNTFPLPMADMTEGRDIHCEDASENSEVNLITGSGTYEMISAETDLGSMERSAYPEVISPEGQGTPRQTTTTQTPSDDNQNGEEPRRMTWSEIVNYHPKFLLQMRHQFVGIMPHDVRYWATSGRIFAINWKGDKNYRIPYPSGVFPLFPPWVKVRWDDETDFQVQKMRERGIKVRPRFEELNTRSEDR
jgi:hypothetical protein